MLPGGPQAALTSLPARIALERPAIAGGEVQEMWGIVPSMGVARDLSPLGEPREDGRPRVVHDHVVDRLVAGGATRLCFVVPEGALDLVAHHGAGAGGKPAAFVVQPRPAGLCDAIFRALPLIHPEEQAVVGMPGALWFPDHALRLLGDGGLSFLCFPSAEPGRHEAVISGDDGEIRAIRMEARIPGSSWIWGAFKLDGATLLALHDLWRERGARDEHVGALVTEWIARGGTARAVRAGEILVDAGTAAGLRTAAGLLGARARSF